MRSVFVFIVVVVAAVQPLLCAETTLKCGEERLGISERMICETPSLLQIQREIEQLTQQARAQLSGQNRDAIVDTELPFLVDRNACQTNVSQTRNCIESTLRHRREALRLALQSPASSRAELAQYTSFDVSFVLKYGQLLVGRRVSVFGCMMLAPGARPEVRLQGRLRSSCESAAPFVPVVFKAMDETRARFFDSKMPTAYWNGTVADRNGRPTLLIEAAD